MSREPLSSKFVCPECAYTSEGLKSAKCPECGYEGPVEPLQDRLTRTYIAAIVVGLSFVAGAMACGGAAFCSGAINLGWARALPTIIGVGALVLLACAPLSAISILVASRWLARQTKEKRQNLLLLCLLPAVVSGLLYIVLGLILVIAFVRWVVEVLG